MSIYPAPQRPKNVPRIPDQRLTPTSEREPQICVCIEPRLSSVYKDDYHRSIKQVSGEHRASNARNPSKQTQERRQGNRGYPQHHHHHSTVLNHGNRCPHPPRDQLRTHQPAHHKHNKPPPPKTNNPGQRTNDRRPAQLDFPPGSYAQNPDRPGTTVGCPYEKKHPKHPRSGSRHYTISV
jgi:hypothetical protein